MYDLFVLLLTTFLGVVLSFLVVSLFNVGGDSDDSLLRDLQQIMMQIVATLINVILTPVMGIWN